MTFLLDWKFCIMNPVSISFPSGVLFLVYPFLIFKKKRKKFLYQLFRRIAKNL